MTDANFTLYTANVRERASNASYPNQRLITCADDLREAVRFDHVAAEFSDGTTKKGRFTRAFRSTDTFQRSDCVMLDCDNTHTENPADWKTPSDVQAAFPGVVFYAVQSRNHMRPKQDKEGIVHAARPKHHYYFPDKPRTDAAAYAAVKAHAHEVFPFDPEALDAAHFFFGVETPVVEYFPGDMLLSDFLAKQTPPARQESTGQARAKPPYTVPNEVRETVDGRNGAATSYVGWLHHLGWDYPDVQEAAHKFNQERCVPPMTDAEVEGIVRSVTGYPPGMKRPSPEEDFGPGKGRLYHRLIEMKPERYGLGDIGAGNLFAEAFKELARFIPERAKWYCFDGRVWRPDVGGLMVMQFCKSLADALLAYVPAIQDERTRQDFLKFVGKWQRRGYRETILRDAAGVYPVPFSTFDHNTSILNCLNGTLNTSTGEFYLHRAEDYLTKLAGVNYDPSARCERWRRFIDEVMQGDADEARYLQKALGYALTGDTRFECFFVLFGPSTRNGKSTALETFAHLLGDYAKSARPDSFAQRQTANGSGPSEDIARLVGARFVNVAEPDRRLVLSVALVKSLTGNDLITARSLHENSIEFRPQFKLFINCNTLPQVTDPTIFNSGRVRVLPFMRHFEEHEQDKGLKGELVRPENLSGILNWCLEGRRALETEGFEPPASVLTATDEYRQRSDRVGRFVSEELEAHPLAETRTSEVYARFQVWCSENGFRAESAQNFNVQLQNFGSIEKRRPAGSSRNASPVSLLIGYRLLPRAYSGFPPIGAPAECR